MNGLSKYYIKKIIGCFAIEMTATETSKKLKVNRNTVNKYFRIIREAIADYQELQFRIYGPDNAEKKYFSWHTNKGLIFNLEENAPVYSLVSGNGRIFIQPENIDDLVEKLGSNYVEIINQLSGDEEPDYRYAYQAAASSNKTSDIARGYFNYAKEKLTKFYGVKEQYTYLYLKELEFRYNNKDKDASRLIWKILPHHSPKWVKSNRYRR